MLICYDISVVFREGPGLKLVLRCLLCFGSLLRAQHPSSQALDQASAAYQNGQTDGAARILDALLRDHPKDANALVLMGAVLDAEQRYNDAETYYLRALTVAPGSPHALNNAANHYLLTGNRKRARELYLKTIAIDPRHANANLQLAQMSVDDKQGARALSYLDRVAPADASDPGALLLRSRALALTGRCADAGAILKTFGDVPRSAGSLVFSIGMAQAECKLYETAEMSFSRALDADPRNLDILFNLGLAALRAGHGGRARSVLETVLRERPEDPDALYALAQVNLQEKSPVSAAALLARAEKVAPGRPEIILLLAQVAAQLEFFEDSAAAYDRYLKLKPDDDIARRERGFALARSNQSQSALRDLEWYIGRHPRDGMAYFELAIAQTLEDRAKALHSLDTAVQLEPALYQARYTRALLNLEEGNPAAAIEDLRSFLEKETDYRALAHLGQAYLATGRPEDAAAALERAVALAPDSPLVLVQYRRALVQLGRKPEAAALLAHLKTAASGAESAHGHVGLIDYLSLSPTGQRARYLANLRENSAADPGNVRLKVRLANALFIEDLTAEALEIVRSLTPDAMDARLQAECGRMLLQFEQFSAARRFLELAVAKEASSAARLDLAITIYHLENAAAALTELERTSSAHRNGDYYLLSAQLLDAQGKFTEAAQALNRGIRAAPTRPDLYLQSVAFLLKHKLYDQALELLKQTERILPDNRDLLLAQAVTLAIMPRDDEAQKVLASIQARWPEWDRPYLLNGIILEIQLRSSEARGMLETAIALGANTPEAYYYEALAITHTAPDDLEQAQSAIARALALTSNDPYICLLAGKVSSARKQYSAAIEQLTRAITLLPNLIPAHYALRDAYKAVGDNDRWAAELQSIEQIAEANAAADRSPFPVEEFVFTVRPPG